MKPFSPLFLLLAPFVVDAFMPDYVLDEHHEEGSRRRTKAAATTKGSHSRNLMGGKGGGGKGGGGKGKKDEDSCGEFLFQFGFDDLIENVVTDYKNATSRVREAGDSVYVFTTLFEPGTSTKIGNYIEIATFVPGGEAAGTATYSIDFDEETGSHESQISARRTRAADTNPLFAGKGLFENVYGFESDIFPEVVDGNQRRTVVVVVCNND